MQKRLITVLFLLLLIPSGTASEVTWGVNKDHEYYFQPVFFNQTKYDLSIEDYLTIKTISDLPETVEELNNTNYIQYTNSSLYPILESVLEYFILPISVTVNDTSKSIIPKIQEFLQDTYNIFTIYSNNGVLLELVEVNTRNITQLELQRVNNPPTSEANFAFSWLIFPIIALFGKRRLI